MPLRIEHVEVGTRVSYEDMANPRREGRVTEIIERGGETPSGLPLPSGTEYRVVWDEESRWNGIDGTVSDLRQHGWYVVAEMPGSIFDGADVIYSYTRTDAISDGTLVPTTDLIPDEPDFARQAGYVVPVTLTRAVADLVTPTDREAANGQDIKGRLWDVLSMSRMYRRGQPDEWRFPCIFALAGREQRGGRKTLHLRAAIDMTDGEPAVTIMLGSES